jgi:hypothetical protein
MAMAVRQRRAETMALIDDRGATVVAFGGENACEARNTMGFLEEHRERREGHQSQQINKEFK